MQQNGIVKYANMTRIWRIVKQKKKVILEKVVLVNHRTEIKNIYIHRKLHKILCDVVCARHFMSLTLYKRNFSCWGRYLIISCLPFRIYHQNHWWETWWSFWRQLLGLWRDTRLWYWQSGKFPLVCWIHR